ncbi:unnamed protein product [Aphanomyces euteiches]|nr:hypothetical protein AC1031_001346 [Aphanomyces cochlioides]KAH9100381.1 hypothetical protein LEN26_015902 [Aphanomyces euteiches]KAH9127397.1 hypothetical protein AeMF1_002296 [Aphanomyces euteiches]KAH9146175.1 hypothetical protein AeRB84_009916 [Aphanomyces euteiches]KAH9189806.1 hypothetical protein AeNC1_008219 [Aphanomyces euteiches]
MNLEDSYDSVDEVDEDAELELSCALQSLARRCKSFSAKMTEEIPELEDSEISEDEDLPQFAEAKTTERRPSDDKSDDNENALTSIQSNIKHLLEKLQDEAKKTREEAKTNQEK